MGKEGFGKEAKSKMLNQNRPRPAQESCGSGKALGTFHSLEGSWEVMDTARPLSPPRLNLCSYNQRVPKSASNHQKLGESHGTDYPSELPEGTNLAHTFISDFWPPKR